MLKELCTTKLGKVDHPAYQCWQPHPLVAVETRFGVTVAVTVAVTVTVTVAVETILGKKIGATGRRWRREETSPPSTSGCA